MKVLHSSLFDQVFITRIKDEGLFVSQRAKTKTRKWVKKPKHWENV